MIRYFKIEARCHTGEPINIYVKGNFSNGWNTDDVVARAEDQGIDFDEIKSFLNPVDIEESDFNRITDGQALNIKEYVAWEDDNGYYEPKRGVI